MKTRNQRALDLAQALITEGPPTGLTLAKVEMGHPRQNHRGEIAPELILVASKDLGRGIVSIEVTEDGWYGVNDERGITTQVHAPRRDTDSVLRLLAEIAGDLP